MARAPDSSEDFAAYLAEVRPRVDGWLDLALPPAAEPPARLHEAMRYAVFAGGKRLRPALALLACDAFGGEEILVRPAACALELIHAYSLIHDDLPCMDDDDFRRGKPSCHRAFDEATAILAGDGLLTAAFGLLASIPDPAVSRAAVEILSSAAGSRGMVGGQAEDLAAAGGAATRDLVERIHARKTGALIVAALETGAACARAGEAARARAREFGREVGLAFQIADDLLDETGDAATLGKTAWKDRGARKATYPAAVGMEKARAEARSLAERAAARALDLGARRPERFVALARFVVERVA